MQSNQLHDGSWAHRIECRSHRAKVKFLANLAEYDSRTPDVRRAAERIVAGAKNGQQQIEALHRHVRDHVTFTRERVETFSPTMYTLDMGIGDCDDTARALMALLRSLGFEAGVQTLPEAQTGRVPLHVAAQVKHNGRWQWLETTIKAEPGEHPMAAARRLGINTRPDLAAA